MKMFGKSRKNSKAEAEVVGTPFDQADGELPDLSAGEAPVAAAEPHAPQCGRTVGRARDQRTHLVGGAAAEPPPLRERAHTADGGAALTATSD